MDTDTRTDTPRPAPGTIVVGIDGSAGSDRALTWATRQARLEHRPLTVVLVVDDQVMRWASEPLFDVQGVLTSMRAEGRDLLASARASLEAAEDVVVTTDLAVGDPRQVLLRLAGTATMLVVGSRGRGPVASLLLGSVSAGVSQHASCPVVVVRPPETGHDPAGAVGDGAVVVGLRLGRPPGAALEFAFRQASLTASPLTVVHGRGEVLFGHVARPVVDTDEEATEELRQATVLLSGMREKFPDVTVVSTPARGLPDTGLLVGGTQANLVVVGTEHPTTLTTLLEGNVARSVTEHAQCAVAVVPESRQS